MPTQALIRRLVRLGGLAVVLASLGYLAQGLAAQFDAVRAFHLGAREIAAIAIASLLVGLAMTGLALVWISLLTEGLRGGGRRRLFVAYAKSSIFKYLPGNVFHFVGRNVYAKTDDATHWRLAVATIAELALSAFSALGLAALFLVVDGTVLPWASWSWATLAVAGAIGGAWLVWRVLPGRLGRLAGLHALRGGLPRAMLLSALSFFALGAIAAGFAHAVWPDRFATAGTIGVFLIAWLAGFVVPGAPGGLGVREAVIVLFLSPQVGEATALQFALLLRVVSTIGDVVLYALGKLAEQLESRSAVHVGS